MLAGFAAAVRPIFAAAGTLSSWGFVSLVPRKRLDARGEALDAPFETAPGARGFESSRPSESDRSAGSAVCRLPAAACCQRRIARAGAASVILTCVLRLRGSSTALRSTGTAKGGAGGRGGARNGGRADGARRRGQSRWPWAGKVMRSTRRHSDGSSSNLCNTRRRQALYAYKREARAKQAHRAGARGSKRSRSTLRSMFIHSEKPAGQRRHPMTDATRRLALLSDGELLSSEVRQLSTDRSADFSLRSGGEASGDLHSACSWARR